MADNRTMTQMLQAPIEGYEDAIVVPQINANNFELEQPLINLVQSNKFTVPTGRVIANDSVIVASSGYVVPAAYDISPGRVK
ncbi:hypothetical protein Tco_1180194 [Tanacetum coccineum]